MRIIVSCLIILSVFACNKQPIKPEPTPEELPSPHFRTAIDSAGTDTCLTFIVMGDWGVDNTQLFKVVTQMDSVTQYLSPRFIVTTGDNFYENGVTSVSDPLWSIYTNNFTAPSLDIPWYVTVGNHDHQGSIQAQIDYTLIDDNWTLPYNFYKRSEAVNQSSDSVDLLFYDSQLLRSWPDSLNQLNWIDSILSASTNKWKLFFGHHTIYSYGFHGKGQNLISTLTTKFNSFEIDAYICGHDHDLQHLQRPSGVDYLISGSAAKLRSVSSGPETLFAKSTPGFLIVRISAGKMEYYFVDSKGQMIYSYSKQK